MSFPILRVLGGALLVLAGVVAYMGIFLGASALLLLVFGGGVVVVVAFLGHRPRPLDLATFVVGILALGAVSAGYAPGSQVVTYSATRAQLQSTAISLTVSASFGSVSVGLLNRSDFAYQVNFTRQGWISPISGPGSDSVTNSTVGGVFNLNVSSAWSAVTVLVGRGYPLDVTVSTGAGSIALVAPGSLALRSVSLHSSTGSVSAVIDSPNIRSLVLRADTGSVSLVAHRLGAAEQHVPITLSASTGSVSMNLGILSPDAVSITASTSLGSLSHSLSGFTVTQNTNNNLAATAGDTALAARSFTITATASLGSVDLTVGFVPA